MPNENLLDLTDEEVAHFAAIVEPAVQAGDAAGVVKALYLAGLLQFGDYGDRAHLRKSWAAMSGCLIALGRHEEPDPDLLADVPGAHRVYLLGHAGGHRQMAAMYRRLKEAQALTGPLVEGESTPEKDQLYRALQVLRGESVEEDQAVNARV